MDDLVFAWRADVCELYFDAADLLAMIEIEFRAASAAFARYNEKINKLTQSRNSLEVTAQKTSGSGSGRSERWGANPTLLNRPKLSSTHQPMLDASATLSMRLFRSSLQYATYL